jgi:redox-sensitive bicupin YhaK (pirin superfamily)
MDNHTVIKPGEVQVMSAGTGVRHSEFNGSPDKVARFLQIWIEPSQRGLSPSYGQKDFAPQAHEPLILVASSDGRAGSLPIRQSAQIWLARAARPGAMALPIAPDRKGWLQLIEGRMNCGQHQLGPGDALRIRDEASPKVEILETSHFLLFDLPS